MLGLGRIQDGKQIKIIQEFGGGEQSKPQSETVEKLTRYKVLESEKYPPWQRLSPTPR